MRLLVSVRDAEEAAAAVAGGADIIDCKEPRAGSLGAVSLDVLRDIVATVRGRQPVTAALGDASDQRTVARDAAAFCDAGAGMVKIGFAGLGDAAVVERLLRSAAATAGAERVVAVAYADHATVGALSPVQLVEAAGWCGVAGILIDTADKSGPGLTSLAPAATLRAWANAARNRGLSVAVAGQLTIDDVACARAAGADIVGIRGAACVGGRNGRIDAARVRALRDRSH